MTQIMEKADKAVNHQNMIECVEFIKIYWAKSITLIKSHNHKNFNKFNKRQHLLIS